MTKLEHFEVFLAVAQNGSFTAAGKSLNISKSAVSQCIRSLETSMQLPLFIRSTRRVCLSDEGEIFYKQCLRLQKELDETRDLLTRYHSEPCGTLRISCNPQLAHKQLLPILDDYRRNCPNVIVEVICEERMPDMDSEQIDIVFGVNWQAPLDVVARKIGHTRYVLCASPHYLSDMGTPKSLDELKNHRYIAHLGRDIDTPLVGLKTPSSPQVEPSLLFNSAAMMRDAAINGMGIVQLHDYIVEEDLQNGTLVEVLSEYLLALIPLYVYYQKHRFVQPKIRQLINSLLIQ